MDTPTRRCTSCNEIKPLCDFHLKNSGTGLRNSRCKTCKAAYKRDLRRRDGDVRPYERLPPGEHAERNRQKRKRQITRRNEVTRDEFAKRGGACVDCGNADPQVMQWDHVDPAEKSRNIALILSTSPRLAVELAKCEPVCSNCHIRRTNARRGTTENMFGNW